MTDLAITRIGLPTGVELCVQLGGPDDAEPIIFLHGFPESHRTWRAVAPDLARDFRVVAPDQRGFGESDKPEGVEQYKTDRILEDLIALADALGRPDRAPRHRQRASPLRLPEEPDRRSRPARRLAIYQRLPQSGDGAGDRGDGV